MKKSLVKIFLLAAFLITLNIAAAAQEKQPAYKTTDAYDQLIERYFASLNEPANPRRLEIVKQVWTEDATQFVYPNLETKGYTAITDSADGVQKQYPGWKIRRSSKVELIRDNYIRFNWEFGAPGSAPMVGGVDYAVIVDGKIHMVIGFFDYDKTKPKN